MVLELVVVLELAWILAFELAGGAVIEDECEVVFEDPSVLVMEDEFDADRDVVVVDCE